MDSAAGRGYSSPVKYDELLREHARQLDKVLARLDSSARNVAGRPTRMSALSDEDLEAWESFLSRFARVSDLFLAKYLRTYVLREDPGFRGSMRDFINQAEKLGLIDDAEAWLAVRELRS